MSPEEPTSIPPVIESKEPRPEQRSLLGWFLMFGMLLIYIAGANASAPAKPDKPEQVSVATQDMQLKLVTTLGRFGGRSQGGEFDSILKSLQPHKATSVQAARMVLAIDKEAGKALDPVAFATVAEDKSELSKAYVQVYGDAEVTAADAKRIQTLAKGSFTDKLAAVHAFEKAGDPSARSALVDFREVQTYMVLGLGAIGVGFVGFVVVIAYGILVGTKTVKPRGFPIGEVTGPVADRMAMRMGLYLFVFVGVQVGVAAFAKHALGGAAASALTLALTLGVVVATLSAPFFGVADSLKRMVGDTSRWLSHIGIGLLAFCANIPLAIVAVLAVNALFPNLPSPTHPIQQEMLDAHSLLNVGLVYLTAAVLAPMIEELTFRGMLFPALSRVLKSPTLGVLLSGLVFALMHPQGPQLWGALMVIGCTACVTTRLTGSLVPSMVMHALHNATVVTIGFLFLK